MNDRTIDDRRNIFQESSPINLKYILKVLEVLEELQVVHQVIPLSNSKLSMKYVFMKIEA